MNTEEKAKAYDEVREKIALRFGSNVAEEIFSEFEMSDDERIRKALIENFKWYCGDFPETTKWGKDDNLLVKDIIAWLEKQGEQKPAWSGEDEKNSLDIKCLIGCYRTGDTEYRLDSWIDSLNNRVQTQPKQEWSEEDEKMLDEIIDFFENGTVKLQHDLSLYASRLKSIKNMVIPQPKQEWDGTEIAPPIDSDVCG